MNIKTIIVGSLAIALAIGGTLIKMNSEDKQAVYSPRNIIKGGVSSQAGYAEYMHMLKADPATGLIDPNLVAQVRNEVMGRAKVNGKAALGLNWQQMGPDNIGGRTRAILIDQSNPNTIYAGGVSGGLFVSTDGSQTWAPVAGMEGILGENLAVSCITQTDNGRIFFGTGSDFEGINGINSSGFIGNGVYEYVPATGAVLPVITNGTSLPNNSTSSFWKSCNAIASYGNRLYLGTRDGMLLADPTGPVNVNGDPTYPTTLGGWTNNIEIVPGFPETNPVQDIDVATDGSILVTFNGKAYYTHQSDAMGSFNKVTGLSGSGRWSGAIAPSDNNVMYLLRSTNTGVLGWLYISRDKGVSWDLIVPGGSAAIDPFRQDASATSGQGGYDDAIAVDPSDWGHILVGGVRLFEWRYSPTANPIGGSWLLAATLGGGSFGVHADKHTIVWPTASTIYIGSDGGVTRSTDFGMTWQERNLGYNVTGFYDVATAANGWILGGSQDNGDLMYEFGAFGVGSPLGAITLFPTDGQTYGDGFDVAFSNQGPGIAYGTAQYGALWRSAASFAGGGFFDPELNDVITTGAGAPFNTVITNWESNNDKTSIDSIMVTFTGPDTLTAGQWYNYPSLSNGTDIWYSPPVTMFVDTADTVMVQDYIQNRFALATNAGVYVTRDAARLNAANIEWNRVSSANGVICMEFSPDGNHLYIGRSGQVVRISGLNLAKDSLGLDIRAGASNVTTSTTTTVSGVVTGIASDPADVDNLIVTVGGYTTGNHVYRCTNATTAMTFTAIQGSGATALPKMPVYDAIIHYTDKDKVVIGTEWGVWTTDNAFSAIAGSLVQWTDESGNGMTHVPVHGVAQQHLGNMESLNSGYIYLGTHGRGFYQSSDLATPVSVEEEETAFNHNHFVSNLNVYPNPLNNAGFVSFDLHKHAETTIKIFNLTGKLVKTIDLGMKVKGNHKQRFDASALSVGSYIISLESGSERSIAKFIVTR